MADYESDDPAERLAAVRAAIKRVLTTQEYGSKNRRQRLPELRELRALEREMMAEIASSGGSFTLGQLDRPI